MLSRNKLASKLNTINSRPKINTISQERKFEIDPNRNYDYVRDPDQLMILWEKIGEFMEIHPNIKTWDDAMAANPKWYDFSDPKNLKLSVFFNDRINGNIPESIKELIEISNSSCNDEDFMSILNNLIDKMSKFSGTSKYDKRIFEKDQELVEKKKFYSWHYRSLSKINRINWLNGAWEYFVNLLESYFGPNFFNYDDLKSKVCTESNYYEFAKLFDQSVFYMQRLKPVAPMTTSFRNKINSLWSSTFFFWCWSEDFPNPPNHIYSNFRIPDFEMPLYEQRIKENS